MLRRMRQRLRRVRSAINAAIAQFGLLRRLQPIGGNFGIERGGPIDRYYIEGFLRRHREDIRGAVLEAGGFAHYTRMFGGDRVTHADVLYPRPGYDGGTLVGNLETGEGLPDAAFDCVILTQVLPFVYELKAAVAHTHRVLRPGGVLLATLPCIAQISPYDLEHWGEYWRFTEDSARLLVERAFGETVEVSSHGNVLVACAFLHGLIPRTDPDDARLP
jgi:SAM-dependent methyltransferase